MARVSKASRFVWVRGFAPNHAASSATGKYIDGTAVASPFTTIQAVIEGTAMAEHGTKFRLRTNVWSVGAGSDPTTTVRVSMYDITTAAATTGQTPTLGTEIAGSVVSGIAPTPRGTIINGESTSFTIDTSKKYAVVTELITASIPASTSIRVYCDLIAID